MNRKRSVVTRGRIKWTLVVTSSNSGGRGTFKKSRVTCRGKTEITTEEMKKVVKWSQKL